MYLIIFNLFFSYYLYAMYFNQLYQLLVHNKIHYYYYYYGDLHNARTAV